MYWRVVGCRGDQKYNSCTGKYNYASEAVPFSARRDDGCQHAGKHEEMGWYGGIPVKQSGQALGVEERRLCQPRPAAIERIYFEL